MAKQKMYTAAENNDFETIKFCIATKKDQNYDNERNHVGSTSLLIALAHQNYDLAEYIFQNIDFDKKAMGDSQFLNIYNSSSLMNLFINKFPEEIKNYILRDGISKYFSIAKDVPNLYINDAMLYDAVRNKNLELLKLFDFNPNLFKGDWESLIHSLSMNESWFDFNNEAIQIIIHNKYNIANNYSLNQIIKEDHFDLKFIDYLLDLGADPNVSIGKYGSPLSATIGTSLDRTQKIFSRLIDYGAEINLPDRNQLPYLYYVFREIFNSKFYIDQKYSNKLLTALKYGADPFITIYPTDNPDGVPLLHYFIKEAMYKGIYSLDPILHLLDILSFIYDDLNILDNWGRNLLYYIPERSKHYGPEGNEKIVQYLIYLGVDPNHQVLIDDQRKVVNAKMNGTLPGEYGKTFNEFTAKR